MKDEKKESAVAFLKAAVAYYASLGVRIERVMTDNGSCYRSKAFARTCKFLGLKHIRTKPYTPKTKAKASYCRLFPLMAPRRAGADLREACGLRVPWGLQGLTGCPKGRGEERHCSTS